MEKIIFVDIDGTLLDEKYQSNSESIYKIIQKCINKRCLFSLNSNRSIKDMLPIYKQFGFNGFIIGENGSFIFYPSKNETKVLTKNTEIKELVKIIGEFLRKEYPESFFSFEDTVELLKRDEWAWGEKIVFLANKFRKYSASIHVRINNKGNLKKDLKLTEEVVNKIRNFVKNKEVTLNVTFSKTFGNILLMPSDCDKATALNYLKSEEFPNSEIIMIGDDYADEPLLPYVNYFYAVGNAEEGLKEKANYIAKEKYTKGVEEILLNKVLSI